MDDPQYIVLAALDTPSRETGIYISGGVMAAPTVGAVMADILPYLGVEQTFSEEDAAGQEILLEDYAGLSPEEARKQLEAAGLTAVTVGAGDAVTSQIPAAGQTVPGGSEVILYLGEEPEQTTASVPDFMGMNRQQASDAAGAAGLYILVTGNTSVESDIIVTAQSEEPGTEVPIGTTIELEFTDTKAAD